MANTFKVVTKAGVTSADVIYTVASSTTTVVLGMMVGNTTTGQITATVTLTSEDLFSLFFLFLFSGCNNIASSYFFRVSVHSS